MISLLFKSFREGRYYIYPQLNTFVLVLYIHTSYTPIYNSQIIITLRANQCTPQPAPIPEVDEVLNNQPNLKSKSLLFRIIKRVLCQKGV